jgi:hypothetical protein
LLSLKRALCERAAVYNRAEFEGISLEHWTEDRRKKLEDARSNFDVGSMSQLTGRQDLLDIMDSVCHEVLFSGTVTFEWLSKPLAERREMWDRYVSLLASRIDKQVENTKDLLPPVSRFGDRLVGVLTWPPYEDAPPPPLFGPKLLRGLYCWTVENLAGIREVREIAYASCYTSNNILAGVSFRCRLHILSGETNGSRRHDSGARRMVKR